MIKIGIIQTKTYRSNEDAIKKIEIQLRKAGKDGADIVCLPEQWLVDNRIQDYEKEFQAFKKISKEFAMTIIPGAFYDASSQRHVINAPIIGPDGKIIGVQEKIHPFDYEGKLIRHGTEAKVFKTACRFGVIICYDMVFPSVVKTMVKKGAEILLAPSRIVKRGINPWYIYIQARSLENRIPILAANIENQKFGGGSIIVDLKEDKGVMLPILQKIKGESLATREFNLKTYEKSREQRFSDAKKFH